MLAWSEASPRASYEALVETDLEALVEASVEASFEALLRFERVFLLDVAQITAGFS